MTLTTVYRLQIKFTSGGDNLRHHSQSITYLARDDIEAARGAVRYLQECFRRIADSTPRLWECSLHADLVGEIDEEGIPGTLLLVPLIRFTPTCARYFRNGKFRSVAGFLELETFVQAYVGAHVIKGSVEITKDEYMGHRDDMFMSVV